MTIVDLLRERARGDATPYIFLEDGEDDARSITARALDRRAQAIAVRILVSARPGDRVLILAQPGLDYIAAFFGCLYAGVIAVPAYPPDPRRLARTLPRLTAIVETAGATLALTTRLLAPLVTMPAITVDDLDDATGWQPPAIDADSIAMLQFTSGSTAAPKGVVLTHGGILANLAAIAELFELAPGWRLVSWLPPYHDMGLVGAVLSPLHTDGQLISMSPLHFLQRPARWLRAIEKYRADVSGGPNFAYDLAARKVDPATVDLSSWRVAFNGAEVVRAATLERFAQTFAPSGLSASALWPCYGLAETALIATGSVRGRGPRIARVDRAALERGDVRDGDTPIVSSGRPASSVQLRVVDADGRDTTDIGEIWLAGPSLGRGYWGGEGFGAYLRTGDLGFVRDGELYVCGRLKDVVILNGRKLFPDDIERVVAAAHPALRPGGTVAFAADVADVERLVIVQEADGDTTGAATAITRAVFEAFDVSPHAIELVARDTVPKTSSGKVQRHACRAAWLAGQVRSQ